MSLVHLHLLLNHFPVIGIVIVALLLVASLLRRSAELAKVSLTLLVLVGAISILVFFTGEPAEDAVERLAGISKRMIHRHEEAAEVATIVTAGIGALALGALAVYRRRALPRWVTVFALLGAVGSTAIMGYAANLGGQIRHSEIGGSAAVGVNVETGEREGH